jgi:hypothetical protein
MKAGTEFRLAHYLRAMPLRETSVVPRNARFCQVPLGRYFFFVGSLLVAMLFVAEWYLPDSPQSFVREAYVDKSIIRIKSAHKWPERLVIDTSLPTIVPPTSAVLASTPLITPPREAFAQVDAPSQQVSRTASLPSSKPKVAKKVTHTRVAAYRDSSQASMPEVAPREVLPAGW